MNTCIIILGASGDLARRKLIPALYYLCKKGLLSVQSTWIGVAQDNLTIAELVNRACTVLPNFDPTIIQELIRQGTYCKMSLDQESDYASLKKIILKVSPISNRLVYCALPSDLFSIVTHNLCTYDILQQQKPTTSPWHRIAFEKHFGHDYQSATLLNSSLLSYLNKHQMWRVDHYLSKNSITSIPIIRFANIPFRATWSHEYIDYVCIELSETSTIAGRGRYYDNYGALKDVVQNHLLQILALITMEEPLSSSCEHSTNAKEAILKKTYITSGILGQYKGYLDESGVAPNSRTETFALLKATIDTPRWKNVPFFLKTGKALDKHAVKISIYYKMTDFSKNSPTILTFNSEPHTALQLYLAPQEPSLVIEPLQKPFLSSNVFEQEKVLAHEKLLYSILQNNHCSSVTSEEINAAWKIVDHIQTLKLPLYYYDKASQGPQEASIWLSQQIHESTRS